MHLIDNYNDKQVEAVSCQHKWCFTLLQQRIERRIPIDNGHN
jgi:hypothetical protein